MNNKRIVNIKDLQDSKEKLASQISRTALFRIKTAKKYPDDAQRNLNASTALFKLYEYLGNISREHPVFARFMEMSDEERTNFEYFLSRYGFSLSDKPNPELFVNEEMMRDRYIKNEK